MPQFDPASYASQVFWLVSVFLALFLYIRFIFTPRLSGILHQRDESIAQDLNKAEKIRTEIQQLIDTQERLVLKTKGEIKERISQTIQRLSQEQQASLDLLEAEFKKNTLIFEKKALKSHQDIAKNMDILVQKNVEMALQSILSKP